MTAVNITEFRANLLHYLTQAQAGESFSVTSGKRVLATVSAPQDEREKAREKLRAIARTARIGDVTSPIDIEWNAMQ